MRLDDKLYVQVPESLNLEETSTIQQPQTYVTVDGKHVTNSSVISYEYKRMEGVDENLDPVQENMIWMLFGNCIIIPNSRAQQITLNDGSMYLYAYEIIAPIKKIHYQHSLIPKEGTSVRIVKKDGSINKEAVVRGFVTLKQRYVKVWL
jgi:hypothetical protein